MEVDRVRGWCLTKEMVLQIDLRYICTNLNSVLPVIATEDRRSKVSFPSGFGYSRGLQSAAGLRVSLSL